MAKRIYVIDTCVLLHDPQAIYKFAEHDIYIPLAVIDDLDDIKTRKESVSWSAREVFRTLDKFDINEMNSTGAVVNDKGGRLFILHDAVTPPAKGEVPNIVRVNSDNALINACLTLKSKFSRRKIILVTKDTGLRVRAITWGCEAENYRSDLLENTAYQGMRYTDINSNEDWSILWANTEVRVKDLTPAVQDALKDISPNEFIIFRWGDETCTSINKNGVLKIIKDKKNTRTSYCGISPKSLEQRCAMEVLADDEIPLVTLSGPAGTGKTMMALAVALQGLADGMYDRIIVIKPIVPVGGKDIGALPGDKWEKLAAWLGPIRDNIEQIVNKKGDTNSITFEDLVQEGKIEAEAMTYIQGRSIPHAFVLVDECQNLTPREARMVVERCGKGSKVVLLGDISQVENPFLDKKSCGLAHAINGGRKLDACASVQLQKVERSPLAAVASLIFKQPEAHR